MNKDKIEEKIRDLRKERNDWENKKADAIQKNDYTRADRIQDKIDLLTERILILEEDILKG